MKVMKPGEKRMQSLGGLDALDLDPDRRHVISIVGAGGKTSTLMALAQDIQNRRIPAIVTTTTHMYHPEPDWAFTGSVSRGEIEDLLGRHGILWVGSPCPPRKISGVTEEDQKVLSQLPYTILAEADGARQLPVKIPGEREPVIFPQTTLLIGVLGLDALGKRIRETAFRSKSLADFLGKSEDDRLTGEDYVRLITSRRGLYKGVEADMEYKLVLNQADDKEREEQALSIRTMLPEIFQKVTYITSYR